MIIPDGPVEVTATGLKRLNVFHRLAYYFSTDYRSKIDGAVHREMVKLFNNEELVKTLPSLEKKREFLQKQISRLNRRQFKREALKDTRFYTALKTDILAANFIGKVDPGEESFWNTVVEGQIADWAGVHMIRNQFGTSGNYQVRDLAGRSIGLFKPVSESPHGPHNPHLWIKIRNLLQNLCLNSSPCTDETRGHAAEEYASRVNDLFGWTGEQDFLVPTTRRTSFISQSLATPNVLQAGSFQLFLRRSQDGYRQFGIRNWLPPGISAWFIKGESLKKKISQKSFNRFALVQYLICNTDGNLGNMLFEKGKTDAHAIDSWNSMPHSKPVSYRDRRGLHLWNKLPWAKEKIPADLRQLVIDNRQALLDLITVDLFGDHTPDIKTEMAYRIDRLIANPGFTWHKLSRDDRL